MSNKQSRRIVESRSNLGAMDFDGIKKWIGVDANPDSLVDVSGGGTDIEID